MALQDRRAGIIVGGIWLAGRACSVTVFGGRVGGSLLTFGGQGASLCWFVEAIREIEAGGISWLAVGGVSHAVTV
jgi:hypothetical protein